ncbi:MAG: hypothetical protein FJ087_12815 [Deltaproteobacteria bacterium]|nr:hypothetical protein [Deltaproteobacteria bacterium]
MTARGIVGLAVGMAVSAGCRDKEPYKPGNVKFTGIGRGDAGGASTIGWERDVPAVPSADAGPKGPRPVAAVLTPEGSLLVEAGPAGRDLAVHRVPRLVRVMPDGSTRTLRVVTEPAPKPAGARRDSSFAHLKLGAGGRETDLATGFDDARPDLKAAARADPDLATEFYHVEKVTLLGVRDGVSIWVTSSEGFQGGAHPYARKALIAIDIGAGKAVDFLPDFGSRDLVREALGPAAAGECVRHLSGVGPVEDSGGAAAWVAALTHEFESCAGALKLASVKPPAGAAAPARQGSLVDGVLALPGSGPKVPGVVDWRASESGDVVVMLMALGRDDRVLPPWAAKAGDARTRELRVWVAGMESPAVVGRVPGLLAVQFLSDHAAPDKVLAAFGAL